MTTPTATAADSILSALLGDDFDAQSTRDEGRRYELETLLRNAGLAPVARLSLQRERAALLQVS